MLVAAALVTAIFCVLASAARLTFALVPTGMDPATLAAALARGGRARVERLERAVASEPRAGWERALFASLRASGSERTGLVNEQLGELDHLVQRWVRVPRVCASICTSSGFLLAAMTLRSGLADPAEPGDGGAVDALVLQAINVAAVGLAGAAFCVAMQMRARKAAAESARAFDRLVEQLERETGHTDGQAEGQREGQKVGQAEDGGRA